MQRTFFAKPFYKENLCARPVLSRRTLNQTGFFFYQENLCQTSFQSWARDNIASQKRDNGLEKIRKII